MRLIDADELKSWLNGFIETDNISPTYMRTLIDTRPTVESIPIEWLKNFTSNYCDLAAAIDTQFFINEFILKRWRAEKDWAQVKNNAEKTYQYLKKLLREGKTLEAAKFVEEKENE